MYMVEATWQSGLGPGCSPSHSQPHDSYPGASQLQKHGQPFLSCALQSHWPESSGSHKLPPSSPSLGPVPSALGLCIR